MSKRYKFRQRNAAKLERSAEVIDEFMANVVGEFKKMHEAAAKRDQDPEPDYDAPKPLTAQENHERNYRRNVP